MSFEIEDGVPEPNNKKSGLKYPFSELDEGQSFFVSGDSSAVKALRSAASIYGKRHGVKLRVAIKEGGARCWRVKSDGE